MGLGLPASMAWQLEQRRSETSLPATGSPGAIGSRVLIVDDAPGARACLRAVLEILGVSIAEAADGAEAFGYILAEHFELVVTDLRMEPVDGARLIMAIHLLPLDRRPQILVHSADAGMPSEVQRHALRRVDGIVVKPATPATLLGAASRLLTR